MVDPKWQASTSYAIGDTIVDSNGNIAQCTTAGTSGAAAPTWATTVGKTTADGGVVWTLRVLIKPDTTKLVEEAKLYWTVQSLIVPVVGYLLSHLTPGDKLQDSVFCLLALVTIVVGAVYNVAGAGYIYEARLLAGLPIRHDFFCAWMATVYVILAGVTVGLFGHFVGSYLGFPLRAWLLISAFALGCMLLWTVSRVTYKQVAREFSQQNVAGFDQYLRDVKRLYDPKRWQILILILIFLFPGIVTLATSLVRWPSSVRSAPVSPTPAPTHPDSSSQ
jgi:hypothetical protein